MEIEVRPFRPEEDLLPLVDLYNAVERAEGREGLLTVERFQSAIAAPNLYRWVALDPGRPGQLSGYGVLFQQNLERCYGDVRVHPDWRRQGIGHRLIGSLLAKARSLPSRYVAIDVAADNRDAIRFLLSQGFRYRGATWALMATDEVELPESVWPSGYRVRTFGEVNDVSLYTALCNATFGDLWGHWENTPGLVDVAHMLETLSHFDPRGIFIVMNAAGEAVAHCRALAAAGDSPPGSPHLIDQPGVIPGERTANLHAPLALSAARWLREHGPRPIRLESWGDPAETISIYQALGFQLAGHEASYVLEIDEAVIIRPLVAADLAEAKTVMLTVAAGIFEPDHPAATFINRYGAALSDVDDFQRQYGPPGGTFLVAVVGETIIGTGAIRRIDDETAELRRMWLLPEYHGRGIGYRLVQALFAFARRAGYKRIRLSTSAVQERAIRFYQRIGFYTIDRYRDTDDEIFMEYPL